MKYFPMVLIFLFLFSILAFAQDPGLPELTVDPTKDVEYKINQGEWTVVVPTEVAILDQPLSGTHKWVHNLTANPNIIWEGELTDHTVEAPHTARWVIDSTGLTLPRFFCIFQMRWRCRAYAGTDNEIEAEFSDPNRIYLIKFGPLALPVKVAS